MRIVWLACVFLATSAGAAPAPVASVPPATAVVAAGGVVGRRVLGPDGQEIGRLVDVLVDPEGQVRAAVIDLGGFLGVGTRRIAVDWSDLTFPPAGKPGDMQLDLEAAQIASAPVYTDQTKPANVVQPSAGLPANGH